MTESITMNPRNPSTVNLIRLMLSLLFVRRQRDESELIMLQKEVLGAVKLDQEYEHREHHRCQRLTSDCFCMAVSPQGRNSVITGRVNSASKKDGVTFGDTCVRLAGTNRRKRTMIRIANPLARRARNSRSDRCGCCLRDADRGSDLMRGYSRLPP